jgi:glycosyltransferase involved in cell wall biosynthesis
MSDEPAVSVVMSVFNGERRLTQSVDSILSQKGVDLELVLIDDGSTDGSGRVLDGYSAADSRVRVIHQHNQGLTRALIAGCSVARGKYVARNDVGDVSLPGRLLKQFYAFQCNPAAALVSCGTRLIGPAGEILYDILQSPTEAAEGLSTLDLRTIRGPSHHGAAMFPLELYNRVGGYRAAFYLSQDLDLWLRLAEFGGHIPLPEILYQAGFRIDAISSVYRKEQVETARIIVDCAIARRRGSDETRLLARAERIRPLPQKASRRRNRAGALYFVGTCLQRQNDGRANSYFRQALATWPFHLRAAARLLVR